MTLDIPTLFATNLLCCLIFAAATFLAGYRDPGNIYWHSWAKAYSFGVIALACVTFAFATGTYFLVLATNMLLVPAWFFFYKGIRLLANKTVSSSYLYLGLVLMLGVVSYAYSTTNMLPAEASRLLLTFGANLAAFYRLLGREFGGLSSRYGILLACLLQGSGALFHLLYDLSIGYSDFASKPTTGLQLHLLASISYTVLSGTFLFSLAHERTAAENREDALRDPLTGAFNRRAFDQYLQLSLARNDTENFALLQFDLDHFKSINDQYGHPAGDQVLTDFTRLLRDITPKPRIVARLGGEEFAVIATNLSNSEAQDTAEQIRQALQNETFEFGDGRSAHVTTSIGFYYGNGQGCTAGELMSQIDQSLYKAKRQGRNRIVMTNIKGAT